MQNPDDGVSYGHYASNSRSSNMHAEQHQQHLSYSVPPPRNIPRSRSINGYDSMQYYHETRENASYPASRDAYFSSPNNPPWGLYQSGGAGPSPPPSFPPHHSTQQYTDDSQWRSTQQGLHHHAASWPIPTPYMAGPDYGYSTAASPNGSTIQSSLPSESPSPESQGGLSFEQLPSVELEQLAPTQQQEASANSEGFSYQEQVQLFARARSLPSITATGPFVPQLMYRPHTSNDRRRYVEEILLDAPIEFWVNAPEECGISLDDAFHSRVRRLHDREGTVFRPHIGPSISIRIEWPGYRPWSRQIPTRDFRSPPGPITRSKLAKNVAKCVQRFIADRQDQDLEVGTDPRWAVGFPPGRIQLQDLFLVSLHHVSMGSWQPQLRLRRPLN